MEKEKIQNALKRWLVIILSLLFFVWICYEIYSYIDFQTHNTNTKAVIIGDDYDGQGTPLWVYEYFVNGKKYEFTDYVSSAKNAHIGDTINIKYNYKHPDRSIISDN